MVIAIIGLLASIVLVSMGGARAKARDAKRQSDIRQISTAMEMCLSDSGCGNGSYIAITAGTPGRLTTAAIGTYLSTIPLDLGGGSSSVCNTDDSAELSAGAYCGWTSAAGSEYCIYAKLSDGNWAVASEKGVSVMSAPPGSLSACP